MSGEETSKCRHLDAWAAVYYARLKRIARNSMEPIAVFLTSPAVAPGTSPSPAEAQVAMADEQESSPEAAGIFRIFRPQADPISTDAAGAANADNAGPVPL